MKEVVANVYLTKIEVAQLRNVLTEWCNGQEKVPDIVHTIRQKLDLIPIHETIVKYLKQQIKLGNGSCQASVRRVGRFSLVCNNIMALTRNLQTAYKVADHYCKLLGGYVWTHARRYSQKHPTAVCGRATRIYQFG